MAAPVPQTVALALGGPIRRADLRALGTHVSALLDESDAALVLCDVTNAEPDAVTIDALARVSLAAKRHGCKLCVRGASRELIALLDSIGLRELAPA